MNFLNKVDSFLGLKLRFDWTVLVLITILSSNISTVMSSKFPNASYPHSMLIGLIFSALFLLSIIGHEMAHVTVGRRFGVQFKGITIFMLGGAANMKNYPRTAKSEFWMALAGPVFSFVVGFISVLFAALFDVFVLGNKSGETQSEFVWLIAVVGMVNIAMGVFNLLPLFPLDGGRIFRSTFWHFNRDLLKSTKIASTVGQAGGAGFIGCGLAMMLGIYIPFLGVGIGSGIWIAILGLLIIFMARQEYKVVRSGRHTQMY